VTDENDLYAHTIFEAYESHLKELDEETSESSDSKAIANGNITNGQDEKEASTSKNRHIVPGIDGLGDGLSKDGNKRARNMSILCGSMHPFEEDHADGSEKRESVFVFPDYKVTSCFTFSLLGTGSPNPDAVHLIVDDLSLT